MCKPTTNRRHFAPWFGLFGGAFAWLGQLLVAAVAAEFGCFSHADRWSFAGITAISWVIISVSVVAMLVTVAAIAVSRALVMRASRHSSHAPPEVRDNPAFMARAGVITSSIFLLVIAAQTVPLFFYFGDC